MATRTKAEVIYKSVKDIILGDKLLTEIKGYRGDVLIPAGHTITVHDLNWIKKRLTMTIPKLPSEMYIVDDKAKGNIKNKAGETIIKAGRKATEEELAVLAEEGFRRQDIPGGKAMYTREQKWPEDKPWYLADINPEVKVETTVLVDDETELVAVPAGAGAKKAKTKRGRPPKATAKADDSEE